MRSSRSYSIILILLQLFLGVGALGGGTLLMLDPSGELVGMPVTLLQGSLFHDYFIPGFLLFSTLGVLPMVVASGLYKRWSWAFAEKLNVFRDHHWSWTFSLYSGFQLIIWITIQVYIMNMFLTIHFMYITLGLVLQIAALLPVIQDKYKR